MTDSNNLEINNRMRAMVVGWCQLGKFWSEKGLRKLKREILLGKVVEPGISGLEAFVLKKTEEKKLDSQTVKYLRALMQGRAKTIHIDSHVTAMSNVEVLKHWKILPVRAELAVRRIKWLQSMCRHKQAHRQTLVAIFGHIPNEPPTLDEIGRI